MPVFIGYYRDKDGEIVQISGVAFHSITGEEIVLVPSKTGVFNYPNKRLADWPLPKMEAVPRAVFDNQYTFMGEEWYPPGYMEDCGYS